MTIQQHFLDLLDIPPDTLQRLISRAIEIKQRLRRGEDFAPLPRRVMGMVFEKASTRTRVSFETGMAQLGGSAIFISPRDSHLGRGEPVEDTARVLSSMVDILVIRTFGHDTLHRFAEYSRVPVINALTDHNHPCQLLADVLTYVEQRGSIQGRTVAWVGDGNNMCNSYLEAALQFDFQLRLAIPEGFDPDPALLNRCENRVSLHREPREAVAGAHLVTTDVWASMGQEDEQQRRLKLFAPFQVTPALMAQADPQALFLHCLPAHRGEEVAAAVIDGPQSRVWEQAENRLHAQKALIEWLLTEANPRA